MEELRKNWRGGGGATSANLRTTNGTTTIRQMAVESDEDDDDGPFFDMEFTVPEDDDAEHDFDDDDEIHSGDDEGDNYSVGTDGEEEFDFTISSGSSGGRTDPNLALSPSDDLFFKGKLVPLEPSDDSDLNSKPQFPVSLLKSATKFRVFMLGFKKQKSTSTEKVETNGASPAAPKQLQGPQQEQTQTQTQTQTQEKQSKFFTVKLKVEEVPIVSLLTRDNSSRSSGNKINKQSPDEVASDDKRFAKDVVQKYLKMIKPLYVRVSKRYGEKLRFSGQLSLASAKAGSGVISTTPVSSPTKKNEGEAEETEANVTNVKSQRQGNLPAGLRVVCKHLGKSRSASSGVAAVPPVTIQSKRQDDSFLQQQDGIQSAILHCKSSFNASRDSDSSLLSRSTSDPSHEKTIVTPRSTSEKAKETRI